MKARPFAPVVAAVLILVFVAWLVDVNFEHFSDYQLRYINLLLAPLGLVFIFFQFVLVSRIRRIEAGFGLDKMFRLHRLFGRVGLILVTLHMLFIAYYRLAAYGDLFPGLYTYLGIIALAGFMITAGLAATYKKIGLAYETWRNVHLVNYLLFPVVLVHAIYYSRTGSALYYLWLLMALLYAGLLVYRAVMIYNLRRRPYEVVEVRQETADTWSLFFKGPKIDYKPGQFMFVQLLRGGVRSSPHPFTISSSPTAELLSITPKKLGDFTLTVKDTAPGDRAFIDAPYGVFTYIDYGRVEPVFIAGGIGITPFMSMLRYMREQDRHRKVTLFWANRTEEGLCFREELAAIEKDMPNFNLVLVMSDQPDWQGEKGYINGPILLNYLRETGDKEFFLCGPPPMTRTVITELKQLGVLSAKIHHELFEL